MASDGGSNGAPRDAHPDVPVGKRGTALITGASSGIGYEFSRLFAKDHFDLILVARSGDRLAQIADQLSVGCGISVRVIARDLGQPGAAEALFAEVEPTAVDVLVNNAGFGLKGTVAELSAEAQEQMVQLNVVTLTALTRLFLPGMLERWQGGILNLASTAAFQPGPLMAVYFATKAYVLSFTEALADEVHGSGVTVTALCPGPTVTGFADRAGTAETRLFRGPTMDAATVAAAGYAALKQGKPLVVPGARNRVLAFGTRLAPRPVIMRIVRAMHQ
ncbi:MAG: SDR family NAD(P)-dependent oxidoreductase [Actinomycetota bacterium]